MNKNVVKRDELLFGGYEQEKYCGGIRDFDCLPETIQELLDKDFIDPEGCQNCSPSVKEFMEIAKTEGVEAEFGGYAVSPHREDYRVTITDITVEFDAANTALLIEMIGHLRYADDFSMDLCDGKWRIYAWWD